MNDLAKKYFSNSNQETFKFSNFIDNFLENKIVSEEQLNITINKVKLNGGDSAHLTCTDNMFSLIMKHYENNTIEGLIQNQEDNYYYPGSLSKFKLNLGKFDENFKPKPLEYKDFGNVTLGYFCQLHKYLTENNIFESDSQKELLKLREMEEDTPEQLKRMSELSQLPDNELCSDYRGYNQRLE